MACASSSSREIVCRPCSWIHSGECDGCIFNECFPAETDKESFLLLHDRIGAKFLKEQLQEMKSLGLSCNLEGTAVNWVKQKSIEFEMAAKISSAQNVLSGKIDDMQRQLTSSLEKIERDVQLVNEKQISNYVQQLVIAVLHHQQFVKIKRRITMLEFFGGAGGDIAGGGGDDGMAGDGDEDFGEVEDPVFF